MIVGNAVELVKKLVVFEINLSVCLIQSHGHILAGGELSEYDISLDGARSIAQPVRNRIQGLPSLIQGPFWE